MKLLLIDEIHVSIRAPRALPESAFRGIRRTLRSKQFMAALHHAIRGVVQRHRSLDPVRVKLER